MHTVILKHIKTIKDVFLYRKSCNSAIIRGVISVLPILALSAVLFFLNMFLRVTILHDADPLIYKAIYTFVVLAFAEELIKYLAFRFLLNKKTYAYSWADVVAFMVIIGTTFGILEDIPYAFGSNPIEMLVRGVTMGHVGYGFIMGWFYGKSLHTGKKHFTIIAFILPFILHGLYDFSLSPEFIAINDDFAIIAVSLALFDIILLILMIRFFIRSKKKAFYNEPLIMFE